MKKVSEKTVAVFFGLIACSFMPHWSCHYYRIETNSSFIVGRWSFSVTDSYASMAVYTIIILLSLLSIAKPSLRIFTALLAGLLHLVLGTVHIVRLFTPFRFELFNLDWSRAATIREILIVVPFGFLCIILSLLCAKKRI